MKTDKLTIRIDSRQAAIIRKAAKLELRSVNSFVILTCLEAAKARLEQQKPIPQSLPSPVEAAL